MGAWMYNESLNVSLSKTSAKDLCTWTFPTAYQFSNSFAVTVSVEVCFAYVYSHTSTSCMFKGYNPSGNTYTINKCYAVALGY